MLERGLERFPVGVNVAEEPDPHRMTSDWQRPEFGNVSLSLTAVNGVDPPHRPPREDLGPIN
jgi:hypothetical protein